MIYEVADPNAYAASTGQVKYVQIKLLDILYDDKVCNLVYMQDVTQVYREHEREKAHENILMASACTSQELQAPQQTIIMLTKQLI